MAESSLQRPAVVPAVTIDPALERRGRWWVFGSFLLCPCHLPLTIGVLSAVFGGTWLGGAVRDHGWLAAAVITLSWGVGTAYGFVLLRRARASGGACPVATPEASS